MKKLDKYLLSATIGLAALGSAQAETIYMAGSTGQRVITQTAISHLLTGATFQGTNSDFTKANFGIWTGTFNGKSVTIKVSLGGSAGGIAAVAGSKTVNFPTDAAPTKDPTAPGAAADKHIPDFATAELFQGTTNFNGKFQGTVYETLQDEVTAVIALKFLGSKGFPGSNITTTQAQLLYSAGKMPVSMITGKKGDQKKTVFALGRNTDSGSRGTALTDIGLGYNAVVKQYLPTISGAKADANGILVGGTVDKQELWPIEIVSGVSSNTLGNSGFKSGSLIAAALTTKLSSKAYKIGNAKATAGFYIGYAALGEADDIAIPAGAKELAFNGIPYSLKNVDQGLYTFWTYCHIYRKKNLTGTAKNFFNSLVTQLKTKDAETAGTGFFLKRFSVKRSSDGGIVTPLFF